MTPLDISLSLQQQRLCLSLQLFSANEVDAEQVSQTMEASTFQRMIEQVWQGSVAIDTDAGVIIDIELHCAKPLNWLAPSISYQRGHWVVVLDDEEMMHQEWEHRWQSSGLDLPRIVHCYTSAEVRAWCDEHPDAERFTCLTTRCMVTAQPVWCC